MENRTVAIENYWAKVVGDMLEFKELAKAKNPEFNRALQNILKFLDDCFVQTCTVQGIERWEKIYGVTSYPADTLEQRRARVLAVITRNLPYTMRALNRMLEQLLGAGNYKATINHVTSTLTVLVNVKVAHQMDDVRHLLDSVVPANILVDLGNLYSTHERLNKYTHAQLANYTHKYIQESLEV
jgi:hypothetical protein